MGGTRSEGGCEASPPPPPCEVGECEGQWGRGKEV